MSQNKKKFVFSMFKTGSDTENLQILAHISSKFGENFNFLLVENDRI